MINRREFVGGAAIGGAMLLNACGPSVRDAPRVIASAYDNFYVGTGTKMQGALRGAKTIYLAALAIDTWAGRSMLSAERQSVPEVTRALLWMGLRVARLDGAADKLQQVVRTLNHWKASGNNVAGLCVEFAGTVDQSASDQASFLRAVHQALPRDLKLSVTGLAADADGRLAALGNLVDEHIVRFFADRGPTLPPSAYLAAATALPFPFRIGLRQGGILPDLTAAHRHPQFAGHTVFLVNAR